VPGPDREDRVVAVGPQQLLDTVLPDGFQQPVPHRALGALRDYQALVHQGTEQVKHLEGVEFADRLGRFQLEPAREHRHPPQRLAFRLAEQAEGPVHRGLQGLLPRHDVPAAAGEQPEPLIQPGAHLAQRHRLQPGRGQLDRQRDAVEAPAHRRRQRRGLVVEDEAWILRAGPLREQLDRLRRRAAFVWPRERQ
jgi:hypothetical protein